MTHVLINFLFLIFAQQEGVLCVILLNTGKPETGVFDTLKKLNTLYERTMERGL